MSHHFAHLVDCDCSTTVALNFSLHVIQATNAKCRGLMCQLMGGRIPKGDTVLEVTTVEHLKRSKTAVTVRSFYCRRCSADAAAKMRNVVEWQRSAFSPDPVSKLGLILE